MTPKQANKERTQFSCCLCPMKKLTMMATALIWCRNWHSMSPMRAKSSSRPKYSVKYLHCGRASCSSWSTDIGTERYHTDRLSCGFTSHSTQNSSFWRRFPEPISWLCLEKANSNNKSMHSPIKRNVLYTNKNTHPFNGPFPGLPG